MHITLIHLSDLHFDNNADSRKRVDLAYQDIAKETRLDENVVILFTGDLVQSGKQEQYDLLFDKLLAPLIEISKEIIVVPGNHDVQHDLADPEKAKQLLDDKESGYLFSGSSFGQAPYGDKSNGPLSNYKVLEDLFEPYLERNFFGFAKLVGDLSIVGMNSAWLSHKREPGDSDRGKLRVEPYVLQKYSEGLSENSFRVLLLHHQLDWLEENSRSEIRALATKHFDLVLFGHEHTADTTSWPREENGVSMVQSPPLCSEYSKGTNGYLIIRCDPETKTIQITYRSYSESRREFVSGEDFAKGGVCYPTERDEKHFKIKPPLSSLAQKFIGSDEPDYASWHGENIRSKSRHIDEFITPNIMRVVSVDGEEGLEPPSSLTQLYSKSTKDQFVIAPADSGLSTSAFLTLKGIAQQVKDTGVIPVFFDAEDSKINKAAILKSMTQKCMVKYKPADIKHLVEQGSVRLIVDGLNLSDPDLFNDFRETMKKYFPKVRVVAFVRTEKVNQTMAGEKAPDISPIKDEVFELAELNVEQVHEIISILHPDMSNDENVMNDLSNRTLESLEQINEPIFPSTVAILVETLSRDNDFRPINKARLLDRYVECLLGRFEIEDVREGVFSSHDKIQLLSYIARKLLERDKPGLSHDEWNRDVLEYEKDYLIELPEDILQEFEEKGLMVSEGGQITFRADYLFSYFIACQMKSDDEFAQNLISDDGLYRHDNEVIFYAELEGTDTVKVLEPLYEQANILKEKLFEQYKNYGIDLTLEWKNAVAGKKADTEALVDELENVDKIAPDPKIADARDNERLSTVPRRRGIRRRQDVVETEQRLLIAMKMYSRLIRNAQNIKGDDKLKHIRRLYNVAEMWVGFMMAARQYIASSLFTVAGGVCFINKGATVDKAKSIADFKYNAPNSISTVLAEAMRNPQLSPALRKALPDLSPMGALFAREALLGLTSDDNIDAYLDSIKRSKKDETLLVASLRKLKQEYLESGRNIAVKNHTLEIIKGVNRIPGEIGEKTIGDLKQLEKRRLLRDLKDPTIDVKRSITTPSADKKASKIKKPRKKKPKQIKRPKKLKKA